MVWRHDRAFAHADGGVAGAAIASAGRHLRHALDIGRGWIVKVANELNAKLPIMVDSETRLDDQSRPGRRLTI
jgi:hypothetical protein